MVDVVSAETGAAVQHFRQPSLLGKARSGGDTTAISCIGWGLNFIDVDSIKRKTAADGTDAQDLRTGRTTDDWDEVKSAATLDDFLERIPDAGKVQIPLDLPEQLARLDITTSLVKLPPLPLLPPAAYKGGIHPTAELFSSQVSLDAAVSANGAQSPINSLEALLLAQDNGAIRLITYDTLNIGEVTLPAQWKMTKINFKHCASHPYSSTYMLLLEYSTGSGATRTALVPLSLRFLHSSGSQLYIIESKTAQLDVMVQYISETLNGIHYHWKHAKELPTRFMDNVNEELAEKQNPNLVQSLFHLAATGDCPPVLREWLVDILAERGHKRWDHSIMHGYTKVRELAHECLLPALDRCAAIINHLRGLAIYYENSKIFDVDATVFDAILNIIRCMRLLAHHVLLFCSQETEQFVMFSKWLRHEIDVQAAESPPNPNEEVESAIDIDFSLLLPYIQGALEKSKLDPFVMREQEMAKVEPSANMFDNLVSSLQSFKAGDEMQDELINLNAFHASWLDQHAALVEQIISHQRASSNINTGVVLEEGNVLVSDLCMVQATPLSSEHKTPDDAITTIVASVYEENLDQLHVQSITHHANVEDAKSFEVFNAVKINLPSGYSIRDLKFVDHGSIMLLLHNEDMSCLIRLPMEHHQPPLGDSKPGALQQHLLPNGNPLQIAQTEHVLSKAQIEEYTKHVFETSDRFQPARIEVNSRNNRRFVVVLGEDCRQMKILDLDFEARQVNSYELDGQETGVSDEMFVDQ